MLLTNAAPGNYVIEYGDVPWYTKPSNQTNTLVAGGNITFTGNYTATDVNTNHLPDSWEQAQFGTLDPARTQSTDTDADGLSDWGEFVAGTDPNNPPPAFRINAERLGSNLLKLSWPSVTNHTYRVHASSNAVSLLPVSSWLSATGTNTSYIFSTATNGATRFFRVEAAPPIGSLAGRFALTTTVLPSKQIKLTWPSAPGHGYRLLSSTNASHWTPYSAWIRATAFGTSLTLPPATNGAPALFRVEAQP
jgi:hypothetical protein